MIVASTVNQQKMFLKMFGHTFKNPLEIIIKKSTIKANISLSVLQNLFLKKSTIIAYMDLQKIFFEINL